MDNDKDQTEHEAARLRDGMAKGYLIGYRLSKLQRRAQWRGLSAITYMRSNPETA